MLLAGQYGSKPADKSSEVVVVNYNDDGKATSLSYDVTELPADTFVTGAMDPVNEEQYSHEPPFAGLEKFVSRDQISQWMNEWREKLQRGESDSAIQEWKAHLFDRYGRRVVGTKSCTMQHALYRADVHATPYVGVTSPCHVCSK